MTLGRKSTRGAWGGLAAAVVLAATVSPASARPAYFRSLADELGERLPGRVRNCSICHQGSGASFTATLADFPHNAFGRSVLDAGEALRAEGRRPDVPARLRRVENQDADGDGVSNLLELFSGRKPGDAADRPTPAELKSGRSAEAAYRRDRLAYRWRPYDVPRAPAVPAVANKGWVRNPIDAFLAAEHERRGLKPRPEAPREVLLRRIYLDLIGLAPAAAEVDAFLADRSPDAYEKVVDRLLASPHYGERWGRHWMDVWRYSDWAGWGEQVRDSQPHIWRWRDWIVESLNRDRPYDRMVVDMLAADELTPEDPDALRATGFLVRNFKLLSREKWMEDVVDHTSQAFLGLTMGCARCHDHVYDSLTQREYYRFRAIFEPHEVRTDFVGSELDRRKDGLVRAFDAQLDRPTYFYVRGDERQPVKDQPMEPGVPEALGGRFRVQSVPLSLLARTPEKHRHVIAAQREQARREQDDTARAVDGCRNPAELPLLTLRAERARLAAAALEAVLAVEALEDRGERDTAAWTEAAQRASSVQRDLAVAEGRLALAVAEQALAKAAPGSDARKKQEEAVEASRKALDAALKAQQAPPSTSYKARVSTNYPEQSSGRRLALARWLTSPDNPLTARVAVNHIWLRHFGEALAPSVENLGRGGVPPTHPQLLDWLAAQFSAPAPAGMGWSMKALHRLIVTSSAYRMASTPDPDALRRDPDNTWLWRMNPRRMEAEIVRDNLLRVADMLDPAFGGPEIDQHRGMDVPRRSLYFRIAAEKEMVFTSLFDGPNVAECYRRKPTVAPQQALAMANSPLAVKAASRIAGELGPKNPDDGAFIRAAFARVLSRAPTPAEAKECAAYLRERGGGPRARELLALVLLNHHDFVTIR